MDIKKSNRFNFRALMEALSKPGNEVLIEQVFGSYLLGCASTLLFSESSYHNQTKEDFSVLTSLTRAKTVDAKEADYIFTNHLETKLFKEVKRGSFKEPEFSASIFYCHNGEENYTYKIQGAGILNQKIVEYPLNPEMATCYLELNKEFPVGFEIYFLNTQNGKLKALSRTTFLEAV